MLKGYLLVTLAEVAVAVPLLNANERRLAHKDEVSCSWSQSVGLECHVENNSSIVAQKEDDLPSTPDIEAGCAWNEACSTTIELSDVDVPGTTPRDSLFTQVTNAWKATLKNGNLTDIIDILDPKKKYEGDPKHTLGEKPCTASPTAFRDRLKFEEELQNGMKPEFRRDMDHDLELGRQITIRKDILYQLRSLDDAAFKSRSFKAEFAEHLRAHRDYRDSMFQRITDRVYLLTVKQGFLVRFKTFPETLRLFPRMYVVLANIAGEYLCEQDAAFKDEFPSATEKDEWWRWEAIVAWLQEIKP